MEGTKFIKAYCEKIRQYYALEIKKYGSAWKVVNVTHLSTDEARLVSSEIEQSSFETNTTLIACLKCGSRKVGGCSCSRKRHQCAPGMKYQFDCVYCDKLKIDYSIPTASEVGGRVGEKVVLSQGQEVKIRFADDRPLSKIIVGVGWDPATGEKSMDVDTSVFVMSPSNKNLDLVYYGDREHPSGCVIHHGDNLTGIDEGQGDDENITIRLDKVPQNRDKLLFVLNIYKCKERRQTLRLVKNLYIRLFDPDTRKTLIEYRVMENMTHETAIIIGMAFKKEGSWRFRAMGQGLDVPSLNELMVECKKYI